MEIIERHLFELIETEKSITFARFMDEVLYSRYGGYYTSHHPVGADGDFFTSPNSHPIFGALITIQLAQMWEILNKPTTFTVIEPGGGSGLLAHDILNYSQSLDSQFAESLQYVIIERFTPENRLNNRISWLKGSGLPLNRVTGCILSNELLDSMPVHKIRIQNGEVYEIFVTQRAGKLEEVIKKTSSAKILAHIMENTDGDLSNDLQIELNLGLNPWLSQAANSLDRGFILTFDYGGTADELFSPSRSGGTVRTYYKHTVSDNPYIRLGKQDITSHVNFSHVMKLGATKGLTNLGYTTQREFLKRLGIDAYLETLTKQSRIPLQSHSIANNKDINQNPSCSTGESQASPKKLSQRDLSANRIAMLGLLQFGGMGDFKVLAQGKSIGEQKLFGFDSTYPVPETWLKRIQETSIPLIDEHRIPLLAGRYPHQSYDYDALWPWMTNKDHLNG
ncbi:hypothetical protein FIM02_02010 [SAR202 cluster bacterium AD-802-E10_MRT_200m]|nr:hypothetical protein [SAR202 cluster bacterium AD-802-E10_MRT_200m]